MQFSIVSSLLVLSAFTSAAPSPAPQPIPEPQLRVPGNDVNPGLHHVSGPLRKRDPNPAAFSPFRGNGAGRSSGGGFRTRSTKRDPNPEAFSPFRGNGAGRSSGGGFRTRSTKRDPSPEAFSPFRGNGAGRSSGGGFRIRSTKRDPSPEAFSPFRGNGAGRSSGGGFRARSTQTEAIEFSMTGIDSQSLGDIWEGEIPLDTFIDLSEGAPNMLGVLSMEVTNAFCLPFTPEGPLVDSIFGGSVENNQQVLFGGVDGNVLEANINFFEGDLSKENDANSPQVQQLISQAAQLSFIFCQSQEFDREFLQANLPFLQGLIDLQL